MLVAGEARRLAVHEIIRGVRMHDGEPGFVERGLQELAEPGFLALRQRHENADDGIKSGGDVHERDAEFIGPLSFEPVAAIMPVIAWMMAS